MSSRILVVEDEPGIADFLVRGLREEGYSVDHVADGILARSAIDRECWDLVILDWWLPGEDGFQVLVRFRQRDRVTPVLFLTARDGLPQRVAGLNAGADDYLCKPFAFAELLARVRALLRRNDHRSGTTLEFRDIRTDLERQQAFRDGKPLPLTNKEFMLLCMFLRNPGVVLTRTRIFDTVWGDQFDGASNTIEVHVKELRRKLEAFGPRVIHTRRHRGYVLDAASSEG